MRIVDYETFIRMPAGTIFAPYTPCVTEDRLEIKVDGGEAYTNYKGESVWSFNGTMPLEPSYEHVYGYGQFNFELYTYDGSSVDYLDYRMFLVLEPDDVKQLIKALYWALDGCPGELDDYKKEKKK
jgi:hypothetical protein